MNFTLNDKQIKQLSKWKKKLKPKIKNEHEARCMAGEPYYGAIGGGYSYKFTPTGIGTCVEVTESITGETLDLSNVEDW